MPSTTDQEFSLEIQQQGAAFRVLLTGELDLTTAPEVLAQIQALSSDGLPDLVLDLSELDFIDITGLYVFITVCKRARAEGTKFVLASPRPQFVRLTELAGLQKYFNFLDSASITTWSCMTPESPDPATQSSVRQSAARNTHFTAAATATAQPAPGSA